jgi:hypothetical protein
VFGLLVWTKRRDFFGGRKNVFLVEIFSLFFLLFRKFAKISMPKHGKRNHDLDVECKSQGVFLQFGYSLFFDFNKVW